MKTYLRSGLAALGMLTMALPNVAEAGSKSWAGVALSVYGESEQFYTDWGYSEDDALDNAVDTCMKKAPFQCLKGPAWQGCRWIYEVRTEGGKSTGLSITRREAQRSCGPGKCLLIVQRCSQ